MEKGELVTEKMVGKGEKVGWNREDGGEDLEQRR
jgi:hypothetical protein